MEEIRNEEINMEEDVQFVYEEPQETVEESQEITLEETVEESKSSKTGFICLGIAAGVGLGYLGYKKFLKPRLIKHYTKESEKIKQVEEETENDAIDVDFEESKKQD